MNIRRPFKATLLAVAIAALSAGCATTSGPNQTLFYGTGNSYRQNGLQISELQPGTFGRGVSRLTVRESGDVSAMTSLIHYYNTKAVEAISANDPEQFAVAWSIGKKLSTARAEQELASQVFLNDLLSRGNGQAVLPGGGRVFLANQMFSETSSAPVASPKTTSEPAKKPRSKRTRKDQQSMLEGILDVLASFDGDTSAISASQPVQVAALGSLAGILNGQAGTSNGNGQERMTASVIEGMKVGSAYSVADSLGNKYIVEKTADGLVLHNPGAAPTKVDLKQMNFMPIWEKPAAYRYEAAVIYKNMNAHLHDKWATDRRPGVHATLPPNRFYINGKEDGYVNTDGTFSAVESQAIKAAYSTNTAYKMVIDRASFQSMDADPIFADFRVNCSGSTWRDYHGETLEYVTYSCVDQRTRAVTYARTFVVGNDMKSQSWDSALKDQAFKDALKEAHGVAKLAEALGNFVPVVGNLDAGLRCAGLDSAIYTYVNSYMSQAVSTDVRKFVSYSPEADTPSAMNTALDCAQGVAGLASIGSGVSKVAKLAKIEGFVTTPSFQKALTTLGMLDTEVLYGKETASKIIDSSAAFSSPTAAFLAKTFYDKVQQWNNLSGAAEAITTAIPG